MTKEQGYVRYQAETKVLQCEGEWTLQTIPDLENQMLALPKTEYTSINGQSIKKLDSAGAWLLVELQKKLGIDEFKGFSLQHEELIRLIAHETKDYASPPIVIPLNFVASIGYNTIERLKDIRHYLSFIGHLTFEVLKLSKEPQNWRIKEMASIIYSAGFQALPIIGLLALLIGVVLTYQMGLQLQNYGANIYIVDLVGLSILREFGPLITAIMVAGRTGSAFTASLGMMILNEEVDALKTMGVTPGELLLIPRIIALFIVLPLLAMWSDIFGVFGGMIMSNNMLDIPWKDFIDRFRQVIPLKTFLIGIGKTPIYALLIASIGCFEGMRVRNSADSVGKNTTKSVVLAIFFIIVADAAFSIIFSKLKL